MSRTFIRQSTQIRQSLAYNDALAAGATLESAAANIEDDLNALRSQVRRVSGETKWYDPLNGRSVRDLGLDLTDIENKKFLFRAQILTDITIPNSQNYVVLSVAGSEAPTEVAAVGAGSDNGALVALLAADVGVHSLAEIAGSSALQPKNLVVIRDAVTGDPILSGGKQVYALIQAEAGVVSGDAFNDVDKQVQLSFVRENATGTDLEAIPAADIQNKTINYMYVLRVNLDAIPEQAFLTGVFVDQAAAVDVTLNNAIDNQAGPATQQQDIAWRIDDTNFLRFQTSDGAVSLLSLEPSATGDTVQVNADNFDVNNVNAADFLNGARFDTGGTSISVGDVAGEISSVGVLNLASAATFNLTLDAGNELVLTDGYQSASTYAGLLRLSVATAEWSNYVTKFGQVSLLNAITQAANAARVKGWAEVTAANINPDTNCTGAGGSPNLSDVLPNYQGKDFLSQVNVFVNGTLVINGADSLTTNDCYPGADQSIGDLRFKMRLHSGDVITVEVF